MDSTRGTIEELMRELEGLEQAIRNGELDGVDQVELNRVLDQMVEASMRTRLAVERLLDRTKQAG
jgi:hypothetical protein